MTIDTGSRGLRFLTGDNATQVVDVRCGDCSACRVGRDYWCLEAQESGELLAEVSGVRDAELVRRWTTALAALAATRREPSAALLVLADVSPDVVAELVAPWHGGPVLAAPDARDTHMRERLGAHSATGRAPLVLTVTDVRAAVRAVERGGQVCGPDTPAGLPSVTELVQRDVTLVSAASVDSIGSASSWATFAERLSTLLGAPTIAGATR